MDTMVCIIKRGESKMIDEILDRFKNRACKNRPFVVGVDGLSGAGKTMLVNNLEIKMKRKYPIIVIHIDDHIVKKNQRYSTGNEEWYEYYFLQWDIDMLKNILFEKIYNNSSTLMLPFYNNVNDKITDKLISITSESIVIIEGIFLQRKEWRCYYDYVIFIDCPMEIRRGRALNRDKYIGDFQKRLDKYERRYWIGENYYLEVENPIENADRVYVGVK